MRLDAYLKERLGSRNKAKDATNQQRVRVNGILAAKPAMQVGGEDVIEIEPARFDYVSRSGGKLAGILDQYEVRLDNQVCADIGASTGGFTQCALEHGAAKVYAIDVGHLQLDEKLKNNPAVVEMEGVNARNIEPDWFEEPIDFVCMDVSFISCRTILDPLLEKMPPKHLAVLIKPQFECGPEHLNKNHILKNERVRNRIVDDMRQYLKQHYSFVRIEPAAVTGRSGNQEYMAYCKDRK